MRMLSDQNTDDDVAASLRRRVKELGLESADAREAFLSTAPTEEPIFLDANEVRRRYYEKFFIARHERLLRTSSYYGANATSSFLEPVLQADRSSAAFVAPTTVPPVSEPMARQRSPLLMFPVLVDWLASKIGRPQNEALNLLHNSEVKHARTSMLALAVYSSQHYLSCDHCPLADRLAMMDVSGSSLAVTTLDLGVAFAILLGVVLTELQGTVRITTQDEQWTPPSRWGSTFARPVLEAFSEAYDDVNQGVHFGIEARLQASELVHGRAAMLGAATILLQLGSA